MIPPSSINYGSIGPEEEVQTPALRRRSFRYFKMTDLAKITTMNVSRIGCRYHCQYLIHIPIAQFDNVKKVFEFIWLLVEMHATKLILIYGFYLGVNEVSVLHISIIVLASAACASRSHLQTVFSRIISLVIGVLLILKMVYQIQYIDQSLTTVDCGNGNSTPPPPNVTVNDPGNNTVNWLGLYKAGSGEFSAMIDGYMKYLLFVTLYTYICLRLKRQRFQTGQPMTRPKILFPSVTRDLADKCLGNMLKYLANFVFYKFGIELTFIMLVVLIGQRMDMVALIYVGWMWALFRSDVACLKRMWPYFRVFIIVLTLLQYVAAVGVPPFLCLDYAPVGSVYWKPLQEWAWLPDRTLRDQSHMLMLDFVLLMFVCRQVSEEERCLNAGVEPHTKGKTLFTTQFSLALADAGVPHRTAVQRIRARFPRRQQQVGRRRHPQYVGGSAYAGSRLHHIDSVSATRSNQSSLLIIVNGHKLSPSR